MRVPLINILKFILVCFIVTSAAANDYSADKVLNRFVWESPVDGFDNGGYDASVQKLFQAYEQAAQTELKPGERSRVGIKVYTSSGPGLATPQPLVLAVVKALESRGFQRSDIFLVDEKASMLQDAGYLGPVKTNAPEFEGIPVYALDTQRYFDPIWFYENNLPSKEKLARSIRDTRLSYRADPDERKSFLPLPLIADAEFWINLPMVSDMPGIMVNGALSNATLWNISNNKRFFDSPANASVAMAEIAGIPELKQRWVFSILTLERYQYMGGPFFNARYTKTEPKLWLSANPIALDALMLRRINYARQQDGFPVFEEVPPYFEYTQGIGYGPYEIGELQLRRVVTAEPPSE